METKNKLYHITIIEMEHEYGEWQGVKRSTMDVTRATIEQMARYDEVIKDMLNRLDQVKRGASE